MSLTPPGLHDDALGTKDVGRPRLAPLDAHFAHPMTLAHEGVDGSIGLGNALMFAARNASFVHKWYGRYHGFSDAVWNGFSLRLPFELRLAEPSSVRTAMTFDGLVKLQALVQSVADVLEHHRILGIPFLPKSSLSLELHQCWIARSLVISWSILSGRR